MTDLDKIQKLAEKANRAGCQCGGQCADEYNRMRAIEEMHKALTPAIVLELVKASANARSE